MTTSIIDTLGNVTAEQAIAYVNSCTTEGEQWFAFLATPHLDDNLLYWSVKAELNGADVVEWAVWAVEPDDYGYSHKSTGVYGEW